LSHNHRSHGWRCWQLHVVESSINLPDCRSRQSSDHRSAAALGFDMRHNLVGSFTITATAMTTDRCNSGSGWSVAAWRFTSGCR